MQKEQANKENKEVPFLGVINLAPLTNELKSLKRSFELPQDSFGSPTVEEDKFIEACCNQNLVVVQAQLDKGVNINIQSLFGLTPLAVVCKFKHIAVANFLLDFGADPNIADSLGVTPLMIAARDGNVELATLLLDKGANVNLTNVDGINAVMCATVYHQLDFITLLAEHGADLNAQTKGGYTPLMNASRGDRADIVKLLLDLNADIHVTNECDVSYLQWRMLLGKCEVTKLGSRPEFGNTDRPKTAYDMADSDEIKELIKAAQHREQKHVLK